MFNLPVPPGTAMPTYTALPTGFTLCDMALDHVGREYILLQLDPILINDTFANNELAYLKASFVATNDVSDAIDGADDPICCGVARGSYAESTSGGTTRYAWFQTRGRGIVKTNNDDDIVAGDILVIDPLSDGGCNSLDPDAETTDPGRWGRGGVGIALADDVNAADTVDAFISVGLCVH